MILGKNLIVSLDGAPIAAAKSGKISISQDFIDVCSPTESRTLDKLPTTYGWSVSVEGLIPNMSGVTIDLIGLLRAGTKCLLTFTDGNMERSGFVFVASVNLTGTTGHISSYSATFEGSGPLYNYSRYMVSAFDEGDGVGLSISGTPPEPVFTFQRGLRVLGVEVTFDTGYGSLYIPFSNVAWAVYNETFSDLKSQLSNGIAPPSLAFVACSTTPQSVPIVNAGPYTTVVNYRAAANRYVYKMS